VTYRTRAAEQEHFSLSHQNNVSEAVRIYTEPENTSKYLIEVKRNVK